MPLFMFQQCQIHNISPFPAGGEYNQLNHTAALVTMSTDPYRHPRAAATMENGQNGQDKHTGSLLQPDCSTCICEIWQVENTYIIRRNVSSTLLNWSEFETPVLYIEPILCYHCACEGLAPLDIRPSADTMITITIHMFSIKFQRLVLILRHAFWSDGVMQNGWQNLTALGCKAICSWIYLQCSGGE